MIRINDNLQIPDNELSFKASRGGGPGGQHVNKVASKVTLLFDIAASNALSETQKERLRRKLASRISGEDILQMSSHASRSQAANKAALVERFAKTIGAALRRTRRRVATRPTRAAKQRRLEAKKRRARLKSNRGKPDVE